MEQRNTTVQWDLIAAAVEEANIEYHELKGAEAKQMRGRSGITFQKKQANILHDGNSNQDTGMLASQAKWLKQTAGQHAKLANKLITTPRRMKAAGSHREESQAKDTNKDLIGTTIDSYIMLAADQAKKYNLDDNHKKQIKRRMAEQ